MKPIAAKTPLLLKRLFPNYIWDIQTENKEIYLTFDDGPIENITPWVLTTLKQFDAKATFFCIGNNLKKHPEIFKMIIDQGHSFGNHTFNHINGWHTSLEAYIEDVQKCNDTLMNALKYSEVDYAQNALKLFRPPYGKIKPSQSRELIKQGYKIVMWDVLAYDWMKHLDGKDSLNFVLNRSDKGSIIVFHDSQKASKNMSYALPRCLEFFKNEGYVFKALA